MARFLYSQIDLNNSSSQLDKSLYGSTSSASRTLASQALPNYYSLKKTHGGSGLLEPVAAHEGPISSASRAISSLLYPSSTIDRSKASPTKEERKHNANLKYFTS